VPIPTRRFGRTELAMPLLKFSTLAPLSSPLA
jgi:hypothetical protein